MATNTKRIAKNTLYMYLRLIITIPIAFLTSRIVLQQLGVDDYGIYNIVGGIVSLFAILRTAFASSTQRFYNVSIASNDTEDLSKVYTTSIVIHIFIALILALIIELFGMWFIANEMNYPVGRSSDVYYCFHLSVIAMVIGVITIPFDAMVIAKEKMAFYAYVTILDVILRLILVTTLVFVIGNKLRLYAFFQLLVCTILFGMTLIYFKSHFKEVRFSSFDSVSLKKMTSFTLWGLFGNIGYSLSNQGTNLLLNIFGGVTANAAQGISMQIRNIIVKILADSILAVRPQAIQLFAKQDYEAFYSLIYTYTKILFVLAVILCAPLIIYSEDILRLWLGQVPPFAANFVILIMLYSIIRSYHEPLDIVFHASARMKTYQIIAIIFAVLTFVFSWIALTLGFGVYSVYGVFIITEIMLWSALALLAVKDGLNLSVYFKKSVLPVVLYCLACSLLCIGIYLLDINYILGILICVCINITLAFFGVLTKGQRHSILIKIKQIKNGR